MAMSTESTNNNKRACDYLVAHRGYTQNFPENTILAIQGALDAGAKYIEIDIQLSADIQPVVFHDRDLNRLCKQPGAIHEYDLNSLRDFSNYSPDRFADKYKGEKIAILKEVVALFESHPDVVLFVELKRISIEHFGITNMLDAVLPCLTPILSQCVMISFSLDILASIRAQSLIPIGAVIDEWTDATTTHYEHLKELVPEYFFCDIATLPNEGPLELLNSKIVCYECTDTEQAISVLERGVKFIETFNVAMMIKTIDHAWHNK